MQVNAHEKSFLSEKEAFAKPISLSHVKLSSSPPDVPNRVVTRCFMPRVGEGMFKSTDRLAVQSR